MTMCLYFAWATIKLNKTLHKKNFSILFLI